MNDEGSFVSLRKSEYFIDKSLSLKTILDGKNNKFLFSRPFGYGKTSFQQMAREFLSMPVHKIFAEEIEVHSFDYFEDLKIVTEDRVNINDVLFLLRNYTKVTTSEGKFVITSYF